MSSELLPPTEMNFVGDGDFTAVGEHCVERFIRAGGLQPHHRVLDVGCGIGRMALPLTKFLTTGSYEGFDIVDVGVQWCVMHITPRFPNFRFQIADVFNRGYNPGGRYLASEYRFPFADESFDFVYLTSVFTHMMPAEVENYLSEIARVLKIGGKVFATCFLDNPETRTLMDGGKAHLNFRAWRDEGCWVANPALPEDAVCFPEEYLVRQVRVRSLTPDPVYHGAWTGRTDTLTAHDVIVATKTAPYSRPPVSAVASIRNWLKRQFKPRGVWQGATESGVTRARAYVARQPDVLTIAGASGGVSEKKAA